MTSEEYPTRSERTTIRWGGARSKAVKPRYLSCPPLPPLTRTKGSNDYYAAPAFYNAPLSSCVDVPSSSCAHVAHGEIRGRAGARIPVIETTSNCGRAGTILNELTQFYACATILSPKTTFDREQYSYYDEIGRYK